MMKCRRVRALFDSAAEFVSLCAFASFNSAIDMNNIDKYNNWPIYVKVQVTLYSQSQGTWTVPTPHNVHIHSEANTTSSSVSFREDEAAAARSFPLPFNGELFNTTNFKCIPLLHTLSWRGTLRQKSQISVAFGVNGWLLTHTTLILFHVPSAAPQHGGRANNVSLR